MIRDLFILHMVEGYLNFFISSNELVTKFISYLHQEFNKEKNPFVTINIVAFTDDNIERCYNTYLSEPVFNFDNQKISTIAKKSGASFKKQKLLYRLTKYLNPKSILELGTSLGIGTTAMALANGSNKITTVEGCENISDIAKQVFRKYQLNTIQVKTSSFEDFFNNLKTEKLGLVYIDGAHDKKSVIENFNYLLKFCHNDSVFIINDMYGSKKMTEAWDILKNHKAVTVSIDSFFWGFLFFRKEQSKQHFTIRL